MSDKPTHRGHLRRTRLRYLGTCRANVRSFFMHKKVSADQFELRGDKLIHVPTGAQFWTAEKDVALCDEGRAGKPTSSGHDYNPEEIKQMAWEIFQQEKRSCV